VGCVLEADDYIIEIEKEVGVAFISMIVIALDEIHHD
jgi:hypothetical protein